MTYQVWFGDQQAHEQLSFYERKFAGELPTTAFSGGDDEEEPRLDKNFNVTTDRKGLYLLERFGDKAVLKVHGSLTNGHSWWHKAFPGYVTSYEAIKDALAIAVAEQGISQIVLDMATGGGVVRGLDSASEAIRRANTVKPVYAHTDSHAFSAGYWLASSARRLTASKMAEVGSIGTLLVLENYAEAAEKEGVKYYVFRAGDHKALGLPYEDLSDEAKAYIQANVEKTNKFFLEHVSRSRNLMLSEQKVWGDGKTFFADEAMSVGLIDQVTTLAELIGSGAPANPYDNRRFDMQIAAEKLAQIAAGADPKDVLTAEELSMWAEGVQATAAEPEATQPEQTTVSDSGVVAELASAMKTIGRLEAKLETAEAEAAALKQSLEARDTQMASLLTVAQDAVAKLQVALGKPKEAKGTPTEVLAQYTELQGQMAALFKTGQQTTTPVEDKTRQQVSHSFRSNH